jgi:uncharacterized protein (DUF2252 family)
MKFAPAVAVTFVFASLLLATGIATAATTRPTWVVNQLYSYNHPLAAQLPGELATKMSKMAVSPFAFYRGTAHLFYQDMKTQPTSLYCNTACTQTWLNGDLHLQNLGGFRDASGNFVYDSNDFDESYWGPYLWDLRRIAVSIILAARENGLSSSDQTQLVNDFLDSYANKMGEFHGSDNELGYRLTSSNTSGVVKDTIAQAAAQTVSSFLSKYSSVSGGVRTLLTKSDLVAVSATDYRTITQAVASYAATIPASKRYAASYYTVKDIRQKLGSGIGSLGRYRYYVLI